MHTCIPQPVSKSSRGLHEATPYNNLSRQLNMYHGSAGRPATPTLHYIGKAELIGIDSPPRHLPRLQIVGPLFIYTLSHSNTTLYPPYFHHHADFHISVGSIGCYL
ncbi:hypothetical protein Pst134EA_032033 [Puccinia striiformis f. sp. tritici]|uniref:uncharacterized protein n=1 Tax=Puccinia striiformis f. sp. tritici TaxID=168172 RepID=UPI00200737A0|nr:uncharacterized protein Pst134EA_031577 [Puccinia striiformis f. sp. tritici]XP_047796988.1 uncharacterized protein Pst134EA_032033 [Puccinia striiformis f. sp. tritici]KAH9442760.1 hypothetical protein Pst134EA_031577 [Puccinia striiformis f. sp. tritici]KAH9444369.1 hypothetical protein Pst134EA_032033 [Puccinia striiformis f. sp. tritici]KAH9444708.1 hypothetical protein Pst134EB_024964 [Puccinia striiformis f. sp. tritici]